VTKTKGVLMVWWLPWAVAGVSALGLAGLAWFAPAVYLRALVPLILGVGFAGVIAAVWDAAVYVTGNTILGQLDTRTKMHVASAPVDGLLVPPMAAATLEAAMIVALLLLGGLAAIARERRRGSIASA
jgi:hypothetical protein